MTATDRCGNSPSSQHAFGPGKINDSAQSDGGTGDPHFKLIMSMKRTYDEAKEIEKVFELAKAPEACA